MSNFSVSESVSPTTEPWVSVKTAAEYFDVSTRFIDRLIAAGTVPVLKLGRSRRVRLTEIEAAGIFIPAVG